MYKYIALQSIISWQRQIHVHAHTHKSKMWRPLSEISITCQNISIFFLQRPSLGAYWTYFQHLSSLVGDSLSRCLCSGSRGWWAHVTSPHRKLQYLAGGKSVAMVTSQCPVGYAAETLQGELLYFLSLMVMFTRLFLLAVEGGKHDFLHIMPLHQTEAGFYI